MSDIAIPEQMNGTERDETEWEGTEQNKIVSENPIRDHSRMANENW